MRPQQSGRESGPEFHEETERMAERLRTERESSPEREPTDAERSAAELAWIREELRTMYRKNGTTATVPADDGSDSDGAGEDSPPVAVDGAYRERVNDLVIRAVEDGIPAAVSRIRETDDPYLIDTFHDELARVLHTKMRKNNLL